MDNRRDDAAPAEETGLNEAVFTVEPIGRGKRSVPLLAAVALAIGIVAVAVAGTFGRDTPAVMSAEAQVATGVLAVPGFRTQSKRLAEGPFAVAPGPLGSPLLAVDGKRADGLVLVYGDVFTLSAVVVVVSVTDARDRTLGIRSVDMPGGSTAFRLGANDRFTVAFDVAASPTMQPEWITANAYDHNGMMVATAKDRVSSPTIEDPAASRWSPGRRS